MIPRVDCRPFVAESSSTPEELQRSIQALRSAASTHGFFYALNTGWTAEERAAALKETASVFALPASEKRALGVRRDPAKPGLTRGYIAIGGESGSDSLECKEAYSYGFEGGTNVAGCASTAASDGSPLNALEGPNVWPPQELVGAAFRPTMVRTFAAMCRVSALIARGLSLALGETATFLQDACGERGDNISLMRLFHYFPYDDIACDQPFSGVDHRIGSSAHTDWGFITLVDQGDDPIGERGGLEAWVADPDAPAAPAAPDAEDPDPRALASSGLEKSKSTPGGGNWTPIPPLEGALVVNCGDWVCLFSRGRIHSPLHRVVNGAKKRTSLVFFAYPSFDAALPRLGAGVAAGGASGIESSAASRLASLSLLADQSQDKAKSKVESKASAGAAAVDPTGSPTEPFGLYISRKWAEVARST